jgi:hypothetical protein
MRPRIRAAHAPNTTSSLALDAHTTRRVRTMIHIAVYSRVKFVREVALVVVCIAHAWRSGCRVVAVVCVRVDARVELVGDVAVVWAGVCGGVVGGGGRGGWDVVAYASCWLGPKC